MSSPRNSVHLTSRGSQDFSALRDSDWPAQATSDDRTPLLSNVNSALYDGLGQAHDSKGKPAIRRQVSDATKQRKREKRRDRFSYWAYYVPILRWAPFYDSTLFFGDLAGALSLTCLVVPQSMSYASALAKIDPVHGLFGASIPSFIYSVLGTCPQLSVAPEAALSLLMGQTIANLSQKLPPDTPPHERASIVIALASLITFQAGIITFMLGLMRLGFLDSVLSRPLLRGFVSAVGVVIMIEQMPSVLGIHDIGTNTANSVEKLLHIIERLYQTHRLTALISLITLSLLITYRSFKPRLIQRYDWIKYVPEILICVVVTTFLSKHFDWSHKGVTIVGKISAGHVKFRLPLNRHNLTYVSDTIAPSIVIAIAGFIDSIVAGKENASKYNFALSPNRELVALGSANIFASMVQALPGYGSITRSRLNGSAGARTPMSSLLTATFTLLTTYYLLPYLSYLPQAILSSIILLVVYSILQETPHDVAFFLKLRTYSDLGLMLATFCLTVLFSVETGLTVSIALSLLLVIQKSSAMQIVVMGRSKHNQEWVSLSGENEQENEEVPGVLIARIRANTINFANAGALKEKLRRLERYGIVPHHPSKQPTKAEAKVLILHFGDVDNLDGSALQIFSETLRHYQQRQTSVYLTHVADQPYRMLIKAGIGEILGRDHFQPDIASALRHEDSVVHAVVV